MFDPEFDLFDTKHTVYKVFKCMSIRVLEFPISSISRFGGAVSVVRPYPPYGAVHIQIVQYITSLLHKRQVVAHMRPVRRFTLAALSDTDGKTHRHLLIRVSAPNLATATSSSGSKGYTKCRKHGSLGPRSFGVTMIVILRKDRRIRPLVVVRPMQ